MSTKSKGAQLRKVFLPVVTKNGKAVSAEILKDIVREQDQQADGVAFTDDQVKTIVDRGEVLDYRATCISLLSLPDGDKGANYAEMRKIEPLWDALDEAKGEEFVLLPEADFNLLCGRVENNRYPTISRIIMKFISSIKESELVDVDVKD